MKVRIWQAAIRIKPIYNAQHGFCHQQINAHQPATNWKDYKRNT